MSETNTPKKKGKGFWKNYHRWVGLVFSVFILLFCVSGIILNHRSFFAGCNVSRWWLPSDYHVRDWNNGVVRGAFGLPDGRVIAYGAGCWLTDSTFASFTELNDGFDYGADNRKISNVISLPGGRIVAAGSYDIYTLDSAAMSWQKMPVVNNDERIVDVTSRADTLVLLTRSDLLWAVAPYSSFNKVQIKSPADFSPKVSLLKTVWWIHSGAIFGTVGRLVVDFLALVLIVLCLTGIVYFVLPYSVKFSNKKKKQLAERGADTAAVEASVKRQASLLRFSLKWHNRFGASLIVLTLILSLTGMCLRPPFMVALVMKSTNPVPGSTLASSNAFFDKMRGVRFDAQTGKWLLGTSDGFFSIASFGSVPAKLNSAPGISPMGLNVFAPASDSTWFVGSFSGLTVWNPLSGDMIDYFTNQPPVGQKGRPVGGHAVTGMVRLNSGNAVFEYGGKPDEKLPTMPQVLQSVPMSLWNFALELHVGRCYTPFLGPVSVLFVFLSGLLLSLVLISGYVIYRRQRPKTKR